MEREILTKTQICEQLCISRASFDNMVRSGIFPNGFRQEGRKEKLWYRDTIELLKSETEEWRPIIEYEGLYEVSNLGRVRNIKTHKLVMQSVVVSGYKRVTLYKENKPKTKLVHRLVAKAFLSNPNNLMVVNHKDGNKLNNIVTNLEWCTQSYNTSYHYNSHIAKSASKYIVLKISQDGSSITKYHNILGAARANNIECSRLKEIISTTRVLNGFIWIKLALN